MERKTLARWLVVSALACFGLLVGAQAASAEQTVQGTQSSDNSSATTGDAGGSNNSSFNAGPSATGSDSASASQVGSNSGSLDQSGTASSGDPVAGAQVTGAVADDVTVQNQNSATNPQADSGDATVTNNTDADPVTLGPQANATSLGGGPAQAAQTGSNSLVTNQSAVAETGDAVGGAQITGIVGGGEHTVQNQNTATCSTAPCANSGAPTAVNVAVPLLGPFAGSFDSPQAGQIGDNDATLSQSASARSGDAVYGSQVAGLVGGSGTVQQQNSSDSTGNTSGIPEAQSGGGAAGGGTVANIVPAGILGPAAIGGIGGSQASQTGDNTAVVTQIISGGSGDALAGAQVTGGVGDQDGFLVVQNQQASEDDDAFVGGTAGGQFVGIDPTTLTPNPFLAGPDAANSDEALASQIGDNDVTITQLPGQGTGAGDAVAGSQVTGAVGYEDVTVQNQNTATDATAETESSSAQGAAVSVGSFALTHAGPTAVSGANASASQTGDNSVTLLQATGGISGDAIAGSQVTGVVGAEVVTVQNQNDATNVEAIGGSVGGTGILIGAAGLIGTGPLAFGDTGAQASQIGDNSIDSTQIIGAGTGDAVAGGQVTGVVSPDGAEITVQNQNTVDTATAESGSVTAAAANVLGALQGPFASATGEDGAAQATQSGDNAVTASQTINGTTGDAIAGGQVTGTVAGSGSSTTIQNQNSSVETDATSGSLTVGVANAVVLVSNNPLAIADASAESSQIGDNTLDVTQVASSATGDAVAGGQVSGAVSGDGSETTIQEQNTSELAQATSGDSLAGAGNAVIGPVGILGALAGVITTTAAPGPVADLIDVPFPIGDLTGALGALEGSQLQPTQAFSAGDSQASQIGDNLVAIDQQTASETGDAVAGAQVTGAVSGDDSEITIQNQNDAANIGATSGTAAAGVANLTFTVAGPVAATLDGTAQATQTGDNSTSVAQGASFASGDAVGGAQITGAVAGSGSDITVQNQNSAIEENASVTSGLAGALVGNAMLNQSGPLALGLDASASQIGDNETIVDQGLQVTSGDAVEGAQVTGAVAGSDSSITVQNQNTALGVDATSGAAVAGVANLVAPTGGPVAASGGTAEAAQTGDNSVAVAQGASFASGDAVAGAQVTGAVAGSGSDITVQNQNDATFVDSLSGGAGAVAGNVVLAAGGPLAFGLDEAQASQIGDNELIADQALEAASGDAVGGAQVTGAVAGDDSSITVQNQNTAENVDVQSGGALLADVPPFGTVFSLVGNAVVSTTGPLALSIGEAQATQTGDNTVDIAQSVASSSGDAVGGAQVTGAVAGSGSDVSVQNQNATTGPILVTSGFAGTAGIVPEANFANAAVTNAGPTALSAFDGVQASQNGDNSVVVSQGAEAASGDAIGGAQVTGVVTGTDSTVDVQNQNTCAGAGTTNARCATVSSGNASGSNLYFNAGTGPLAATGIGGDDTGDAQAEQIGSNDVVVDQALSLSTGDAVGGSQVTGVVAGSGSDVTVQNQNTAEDAFAQSGVVNPSANLIQNTLDVEGETLVFAVGPTAIADNGDAAAQQTGDNGFAFTQDVSATSGDAVAGAQVTGVVGPEDATVQVANSDPFGSDAISGSTTVANIASGALTPTATSFEGGATAQHTGDSGLSGEQTLAQGSGDAVSGAQVSGNVGSSGAATETTTLGEGALEVASAA